MKNVNYVGAVIVIAKTGKKIGPYFLGNSFEAIKDKFANKIINSEFEIEELDIMHLKNLPGYKRALSHLEDGNTAVMLN